MDNINVYLKCDKNVETPNGDVFVKDLGSLWCFDKGVRERLKTVRVHVFKENSQGRIVISALKVIQLMEAECPNISVEIVGEPDTLVERVEAERKGGISRWLKIAMVCLVSFFGTAFTIMAYHNDVGIHDVFGQVYELVMGREPKGLNVLEVTYTLGLALGIIIFFNHVGGRRITKDPTPIEVAMRNYEKDVDTTLIETAERENLEEDVK